MGSVSDVWPHLRSQLDFLFGWYSFAILEHFLITHILVTLWTHRSLLVLLDKITWDWVIFWEQKFIFLWLWRSGNLEQSANTSGCLLRATVCFQDDSLAVYPLEGMTVESSWQLQLKGALPSTSSSVVRERITFITAVASYLNFLPKTMPFCCHKAWFHCVTQADFKLMALLPQPSQNWI